MVGRHSSLPRRQHGPAMRHATTSFARRASSQSMRAWPGGWRPGAMARPPPASGRGERVQERQPNCSCASGRACYNPRPRSGVRRCRVRPMRLVVALLSNLPARPNGSGFHDVETHLLASRDGCGCRDFSRRRSAGPRRPWATPLVKRRELSGCVPKRRLSESQRATETRSSATCATKRPSRTCRGADSSRSAIPTQPSRASRTGQNP
jgi:hypothetical protein